MGPNEHVGPRLGDYLAGELSAAGDRQVEAHLLRCAECRDEADELSAIAVTVATLPPSALPEATESRETVLGRLPLYTALFLAGLIFGTTGCRALMGSVS
jgi:anti-sigma factor RsiW